MQYRTLGNTDIDVSLICLGTMMYGEQLDENEAHQQLDFALEQGINFIDTAELYPVPPLASTQGLTEKFIGSWLAKRKDRAKIILATKVVGPGNSLSYIRGGPKLNTKHIERACEASLKRLQTDYIDLYQVHWPSRKTNYFGKLGYTHQLEHDNETTILDTLQALSKLVEAGKVRHIGVSNETPWGVMQYLQLAEQHDLPRIQSVQNPYNLLNRSYEVGLAEIGHREKISLLSYSPLGFGVLSGKYLDNKKPEGARLTRWTRFSRYTGPLADTVIKKYLTIADKHKISLTELALAFVNSRPFLASTIIGATSMDQLQENIGSVKIVLCEKILAEIEEVHQQHSNPCP